MNRLIRTISKGTFAATIAVLLVVFMTNGAATAHAQSSNSAPSLSGIDNETISICDSFDPLSGVSASDPDGDSVQISVSGDGALEDALDDDNPGTYTLTYTADDGNGGFDIVDRTITVEDDNCGTGGPSGGNSAPSLSGVGNRTLTSCSSSFDAFSGVSASDPDGDSVQISVSGDGTLNNALSNSQNGTYTLTYTADDGNGGFDIVDRTITVNCSSGGGGGSSNSAPTVTGIGNVTLTSCSSSFDALSGVSAMDPDGDSVQIDVDGDNTLNNALSNSQNGTYTLTYTADDGNGGIDIADRTVTVNCSSGGGGGGGGSSNSAPTVTGIDNRTLTACPSSFDPMDGVSATDPDGDSVQIDVDGDGVLTDALGDSVNGTYTLTYTADDGNGGFDIVDRTITVDCDGDDGGNGGGGGGGGGGCINCGGSGGGGGGSSSNDDDRPEPQVLGTCTYLNDYLRIDFNNDPIEVIKLQLFLKTFEGFSNLEATGVFDNATLEAVNQFQMRYSDQILNPWGYGDTQPTGYVYITTKKQINEIFCNRSFPLSAAQQQEIVAFRQLLSTRIAQHQQAQSQVAGVDTDHWKVGVGNKPVEDTTQMATTTPTTTAEQPDDDDDDTDNVVILDDHTRTPLQNVAAAIYTGLDTLFDTVGSTGLLILILILILAWLIWEWHKGHKERKRQKEE